MIDRINWASEKDREGGANDLLIFGSAYTYITQDGKVTWVPRNKVTECPYCHGSGSGGVDYFEDLDGTVRTSFVECPTCHGAGVINNEGEPLCE